MNKDNSLVRVGIAGLGGHGLTIQKAIERTGLYDVRAVFDINPVESKKAAQTFSANICDTYEQMMERDDLEAVVIVSPNFVHHYQVLAAFDRGLHVFVEKPVGATVAEAHEMVQAGEAAGRLFMVGHNIRYGKASRLVKKMIDDGKIGDIVSIDVHYSADNTQRMPADAWRLDPDKCRMLPVMQLGIHGLDLVHYLTDPVRHVNAYARSVTTRPEVVDSVTAIFKTGNGIHGTMTSNYCTQVDFSLYIAGTLGNIRCTPHKVWFRDTASTRSDCEGEGTETSFLDDTAESYQIEMDEFARALRGNATIEADGWSGLRAQAVVEAMETSIQTDSRIEIPAYPEVEVV